MAYEVCSWLGHVHEDTGEQIALFDGVDSQTVATDLGNQVQEYAFESGDTSAWSAEFL